MPSIKPRGDGLMAWSVMGCGVAVITSTKLRTNERTLAQLFERRCKIQGAFHQPVVYATKASASRLFVCRQRRAVMPESDAICSILKRRSEDCDNLVGNFRRVLQSTASGRAKACDDVVGRDCFLTSVEVPEREPLVVKRPGNLFAQRQIRRRVEAPTRRKPPQLRTTASPPNSSVLSTSRRTASRCKQRQCVHDQVRNALMVRDPESRSRKERCPTHFLNRSPTIDLSNLLDRLC
jgi:hypothetical protein